MATMGTSSFSTASKSTTTSTTQPPLPQGYTRAPSQPSELAAPLNDHVHQLFSNMLEDVKEIMDFYGSNATVHDDVARACVEIGKLIEPLLPVVTGEPYVLLPQRRCRDCESRFPLELPHVVTERRTDAQTGTTRVEPNQAEEASGKAPAKQSTRKRKVMEVQDEATENEDQPPQGKKSRLLSEIEIDATNLISGKQDPPSIVQYKDRHGKWYEYLDPGTPDWAIEKRVPIVPKAVPLAAEGRSTRARSKAAAAGQPQPQQRTPANTKRQRPDKNVLATAAAAVRNAEARHRTAKGHPFKGEKVEGRKGKGEGKRK